MFVELFIWNINFSPIVVVLWIECFRNSPPIAIFAIKHSLHSNVRLCACFNIQNWINIQTFQVDDDKLYLSTAAADIFYSTVRHKIMYLCVVIWWRKQETKKKKVDNEQWSVYNCVKMFEGCSDFVLKFTFFLIIMCFFGFQIFFSGQFYEFRIMNNSITIISPDNVRTTKINTYFIDLPCRNTSGMK